MDYQVKPCHFVTLLILVKMLLLCAWLCERKVNIQLHWMGLCHVWSMRPCRAPYFIIEKKHCGKLKIYTGCMKYSTSVSKIANSFTYVVSSEKSYKHTRMISAVGCCQCHYHCLLHRLAVNNRRIDVIVNITIAPIRFTVIVRVANLTSDKVIRDQTGQHVVT